jgi:DNA-binding beta-propeller fold protein YncE
MVRSFPLNRTGKAVAILGLLLAIAGFVVSGGGSGTAGEQHSPGQPRLVSVQQFPRMEAMMDGEACEWVPASGRATLASSLFQEASSAEARPSDATILAGSQRRPILTMRDSYSGYSAVAVDPVRNEVVMTDENLFSILTYDRTENTPPNAALSEPKRIIRGENTDIEFQCSLWVDPSNGDIYAVNNDTLGKMVIFSREQRGNVEPARFIEPPHTTYGIAAHEPSNEILLTVQDDAAVVTYLKTAQGKEPPIRLLQGAKTLLADPHGIAIDPRRDLLYVTNWGSVNTHTPPPGGPRTGTLGRGNGHPNWPIGRNYSVPGTGKFMPPSITVYPRTARGDVAPSRTIQGAKTQLNWPTALTVNPENGELYVANDPEDSVLVFAADANGDVAPIRVLKGPKTQLQNPTGVFFDAKNQELWVANFGGHSATVFRPNASGDTPPLRVIRSAPPGQPAPMLGNPHVVTFDSKREEILVAN